MNVVAIMNTGNDADIIELSIRHNLSKLNGILIIDNNSTDGTREIIDTLIHEFGNHKLKVIYTHSKSKEEHVVTTNFFKESIKASAQPPDFLFIMDADEFIMADDFSELNTIPEKYIGAVSWKCYVPNQLDHKNFPAEMQHRRDHEPLESACHKIVIPANSNGFCEIGYHYLQQGGDVRVPQHELKTIFLAHYPVRSISQINKKIEFISNVFKDADPEVARQARTLEKIETLDALIHKALTYASINNDERFELVFDPLSK